MSSVRSRFPRLFANLAWLALFSATVIAGALLTFATGVLFQDVYDVTVELPEAGGVLPAQEVTVLGRSVGQVRSVVLTREGVTLTLRIEAAQSVPAEARVVVLRRSPIGEQAVDLQPLSPDWVAAEAGTAIEPVEIVVPEQVSFLLERAKEMFAVIDVDDVSTLVYELALALGGRGATLRELNRDALDLNTTLVDGIPEFERLIESSEVVLATLRDHRDALAESFANAADLSDVLARNRPTLEQLLVDGRRALVQADALVRNARADISCLFGDLDALNRMMTGPSTFDGADRTRYASKLDELDRGLELAPVFFHSFDVGTQWDHVKGVQWARILVKLDEEAPGQAYEPRRPTPPTRPGAACESPFGTGVNAVRQADHQPPDPTSPGIEWAPLVDATGPEPIAPPPGVPPAAPDAPLPATGAGLAVLGALTLGGAVWLRRKP